MDKHAKDRWRLMVALAEIEGINVDFDPATGQATIKANTNWISGIIAEVDALIAKSHKLSARYHQDEK